MNHCSLWLCMSYQHWKDWYTVTLKSTLANISATTNTHKQSAVTFEVFVLWLRNQCCYTRDVIGIKMTYRDLPYYEGIRAKTCHEYKFHKNKHKNHVNSLHTFRKWSITPVVWSIGWFAIQWWVQPYITHVIAVQLNMADQAWILEVGRKPVAVLHCFIPSKSLLLQWLFYLPLGAQ